MPLDDSHRLWGGTRSITPLVLGDRRHFFGRGGCGDSVVNVPSLVKDTRAQVKVK